MASNGLNVESESGSESDAEFAVDQEFVDWTGNKAARREPLPADAARSAPVAEAFSEEADLVDEALEDEALEDEAWALEEAELDAASVVAASELEATLLETGELAAALP
jgi:hypothetical protein